MPEPNAPLSYRDAGVDVDAGNAFVERIKPSVKATYRNGVMGAIGGFGGLFRLPIDRYRQPILVSGADGVGTKLRLAIEYQRFDGVGIDLVAMCANDILVCGAEPLYFLDYYATAKLDIDTAAQVVTGIANGCQQAGMALLGGETAEMPGMYQTGDFDLAGFAVGIVEEDGIVDAANVQVGDTILGLAASGAHSNGYSLIRKVLQHTSASPDLIDALLELTTQECWTILLSSHDLDDIERLLDHVAILNRGRLLLHVPIESIQARFRSISFRSQHTPTRLPEHWLGYDADQGRVQLVETAFDESETMETLRTLFPDLDHVAVEPMTLKAAYVALMRARRDHSEPQSQLVS